MCSYASSCGRPKIKIKIKIMDLIRLYRSGYFVLLMHIVKKNNTER